MSTPHTNTLRPVAAPTTSPMAPPAAHAAPVPTARLRIVLAGALLAMVLAALDQNIVNTALPRMVGDLGGMAHLSWVVTAFMLTSTTTTPLYGKLSDIYGRQVLFFVAILLFLALRPGERPAPWAWPAQAATDHTAALIALTLLLAGLVLVALSGARDSGAEPAAA